MAAIEKFNSPLSALAVDHPPALLIGAAALGPDGDN
jgi:hypothetical protein